MIFTCGVRFMRRISWVVSGRLSGSLLAAAYILGEVVILLMLRGTSCRDEPEAPGSLGVNYCQNGALSHANEDEPFLAVVPAIVEPLNRKGVLENLAGRLETHAVMGVVRDGFGLVHSNASSLITTDY